jgi:Arc/MetJ-type ribon-helix-helix transcriptional regulator
MQLRDDVRRFIEEQVRDGRFPSAEAVIDEAVSQYMVQPDFAPGELDRLIAEGEASGKALDGEQTLAQLRLETTARMLR